MGKKTKPIQSVINWSYEDDEDDFVPDNWEEEEMERERVRMEEEEEWNSREAKYEQEKKAKMDDVVDDRKFVKTFHLTKDVLNKYKADKAYVDAYLKEEEEKKKEEMEKEYEMFLKEEEKKKEDDKRMKEELRILEFDIMKDWIRGRKKSSIPLNASHEEQWDVYLGEVEKEEKKDREKRKAWSKKEYYRKKKARDDAKAGVVYNGKGREQGYKRKARDNQIKQSVKRTKIEKERETAIRLIEIVHNAKIEKEKENEEKEIEIEEEKEIEIEEENEEEDEENEEEDEEEKMVIEAIRERMIPIRKKRMDTIEKRDEFRVSNSYAEMVKRKAREEKEKERFPSNEVRHPIGSTEGREEEDDQVVKWEFVKVKSRKPKTKERKRKEKKEVPMGKIRLCKSVKKGERCRFGSACNFAHSISELTPFDCKWGDACKKRGRCPFIHPGERIGKWKNRVGKL